MVEKLEQDLISALKKQEKLKLTVLREVKAGMKQAQIDQKREINDELLIDVVSKGIKSRKESIIEFEKGSRSDLVEKTQKEINILSEYLPEQLNEDEILEIIEKVFAEVCPTSIKDMGKVMGKVTPLVKGKADMSVVSKLIKAKLN